MHFHRSAERVTVQAPAKLNLFFEVLGKRPDGYHEIEMLVAPVGLYDTLCFQSQDREEIRFTCQKASGAWAAQGEWLPDVPEGPENLVVRAVELLRSRAGIERGAWIHLVKRIPAAAGLGGGSSDAAAALWAANLAWQLGWSSDALGRLGAELGSDVPLFFTGAAAICRGRGERVEAVPEIPSLDYVIVRPPAGLSTAAVYRACRPASQPRRMEPLLEALRSGNLGEAGRWLFNRLEPAAESLSPWIERLRRELARLDCPGFQMSGSGTCCFALCRHAGHARHVAARLRARSVGAAIAVRGSR